jgi:PrtD family type I secretion system ABC transporter
VNRPDDVAIKPFAASERARFSQLEINVIGASSSSDQSHPELAAVLGECRRAFLSVALFSGMVNLLMLAGPLYMLQVYDRVLSSRSVPTLVALSVFLVIAYSFQGGFEVLRSRLTVRIASLLDLRLGALLYEAVIKLANRNHTSAEVHQPLRDLDQIRTFLTGTAPIAIVDLPWVPIFLAVCFVIHPWLGMTALAGAVILTTLTLLTQRLTRGATLAVAQSAGARATASEAVRRGSETIASMGMSHALAQRWRKTNDRYLAASTLVSDVVGSYGSLSRVIRLMLQSAMLGVGSYLVIQEEMNAGAMFAASLMMGRALAPIDVVIANWRSLANARQSLARLSGALLQLPSRQSHTDLPRPTRALDVENIVVAAPNNNAAIVANIRFGLVAGEALAVIGPSGTGKSSLVRTLIGVWPAARGEIRLDGAAFDQWGEPALGQHVGYVAQHVEFFDGTIAENIARMSLTPDSEAVLAAGRLAGAHDMILRLPGGYDCRIGEAGTVLSAGQRQRIALARALYGNPFLVVLDEPNANLDSEGEFALQSALHQIKARGAIAIIVSHRPAVLEQCDKVLVLSNGVQQAFGPRDAIIRKTTERTQRPATATNVALLHETKVGVGS